MKGSNTEQYAVVPEFKRTCNKIVSYWNASHKEQVTREKPLSLKRFSLALTRFLEQPEIFNILLNMEIKNLEET